MRWAIYVTGWFFLVFGFSVLTAPVARYALSVSPLLFYLVGYIPIMFGCARLLSWIKARRAFVPASFSGWRYFLVAAGFWVAAAAAGGTVLTAVVARGGGMSGVPLGLALILAGLLITPGMFATEVQYWVGYAKKS